jgi:hypothetical protein
MNQQYDVFEVSPDGTLLWHAMVKDDEDATEKLRQVAKDNPHEFRLIHISTKRVIATINANS